MATYFAESADMETMATIKNTFLEFVSPAEFAACSSARRRTNSSPCLTSTSEDTSSGRADDDDPSDDTDDCDSEGIGIAPSRSNSAACVPLALKHSQGAAPAAPEEGTVQCGSRPPVLPAPAVAASLQEQGVDHESSPEGNTLMLKVLPRQYNRDMLIELLRSEGFLQHCNFLYLPMNFKSSQNVGYAFLNITCKEQTNRFFDVFDGFRNWAVDSDLASTVWWSDTKGLSDNIERYRNSPMMRDDVPDMFKPILLSGGRRVAFPSPTKQHLRRIRRRKGHGARDKTSHSGRSAAE